MSNRTVKFSIRNKLLMLLVGFVVAAVSSYLLYAINIFRQDKQAYVFEQIGNTAKDLLGIVSSHSKIVLKDSFLIGGLMKKSQDNLVLVQDIFNKNEDMIEFTIINNKRGKYFDSLKIEKKEWLTRNQLTASEFEKMAKKDIDFQKVIEKRIAIKNTSIPKAFVYTFYVYNSNEDEIYRARVSASSIISLFSKSKDVVNQLIDIEGNVFVSNDREAISTGANIKSVGLIGSILDEVKNESTPSGAKEAIGSSGEDSLVGYAKNSSLGFVVVSEISKKSAFAAIEALIVNSIWFAGLLSGIALLLALIVARSFTRPLNKLVQGTNRISQGDFKTKIQVKANDEIGILSDSFNFMSSEILRYMSEVQEKARMANELAVAQLVQSSFFPSRQTAYETLDVAGYYTPASECGGDWWGHQEIEGKLLLFIGDATGHGVPAALITATANCCVNLLSDFAKKDPSILESPSRILQMMNKVIHMVGGKILMTFFVSIIDLESKKMRYANASHNPPYLYHFGEGEPSKKDIDVLLSKAGPRLGHKAEASYGEAEVQLKSNDVVLFCTDGIIEGVNPEGKQYGERRFMKTFTASVKKSPQKIIDDLLVDANNFYEGIPVDDDLTLVTVKIN